MYIPVYIQLYLIKYGLYIMNILHGACETQGGYQAAGRASVSGPGYSLGMVAKAVTCYLLY